VILQDKNVATYIIQDGRKILNKMHLAKIYSETKMKCGGCFALFVLMLAEFLNLN